MFCERCGSEMGLDGKCSNPLCESNLNNDSAATLNTTKNYSDDFSSNNSYTQNTYRDTNTADGVTADEFATFVGEKNTEYYLDKFEKYQTNPSFASWNWAAFFLGLWWMLYRKMYKVCGIVFLISFLNSLFLGVFAPIVSLSISIGMGVYGNLFYLKDSMKKINNIRRFSANLNPADFNNRLILNGGTNIVAPLVLAAIMLIVIIIIITTFAAAMSSVFYSF
ncbi:MAG: DUF2628 domain-containing protein [Clostridium sp.]|uniref:DUF2628 domain-containing protein n=1 Tax=Clostridium sp. TaxID=1506 RepID=UPI003F3E2BBC